MTEMATSESEMPAESEMCAGLDEGVGAGVSKVWEQTCDMIMDVKDIGPDEDAEVDDILGTPGECRRKSNRKRTTRRPFSPDKTGQKKGKGKQGNAAAVSMRRKRKPATKKTELAELQCDRLANGTPFCCDLCKSPYVCNRGNKRTPQFPFKRVRQVASPRYKVDPRTGRTLRLCNACGLAFDRPPRPPKVREFPSPEEKEKYLEEGKQFAQRLCTELNDPDAERLFCPSFRFKACGCIQSYILFEGEQQNSTLRAEKLLKMVKEAKQLSALKCYPVEVANKPARSRYIGLGNGMKKSKLFEEFVMKKRQYLKETLKLCERGAQKVLLYSNNFIHKKLKSEHSHCRARRVIGKAALGLLPELLEMKDMKCCIDNCVKIAATHSLLLQEWRERAKEGQAEARRVLAEMLTPSGGARANCYRFISMVTGCSLSLIGCVNDQMKRTGGDRRPPTHGLKKYWQASLKRAKDRASAESEQGVVDGTLSGTQSLVTSLDNSGTMDVNTNSTSYQFELQRQQLLQLQRQLSEQQTQLQQHQQLVQQQLLQQTLLQQLSESGSCAQVIQPGSIGNGQITPPASTGMNNTLQPIIVASNQLPAFENSQAVSILPQIQAGLNPQMTAQAALLPAQTAPCTPASAGVNPQTTVHQPTLLAATATGVQQQQQPMQTVQVMIANIELPNQQNQAVQVIMPQQQQQQQQHNMLLQQQQQHAHIMQQQQQPNPLITGPQQQHDTGVTQTLGLPNTQGLTVQIQPPADHTYSQSHPRPVQGNLQIQPIAQAPFQLQVLPRQLSANEAGNAAGVASVSMATPTSSCGFAIDPHTAASGSSPIQMLSGYTAEPLDGGHAPQTSRSGWPSEMPSSSACITAASVSPALGISQNNSIQSQNVAIPNNSLNIQNALQQIFSIVNIGGVSGLCSGSLASDTSSPVSSPTKSGPSPTLQLAMLPSSSQSGLQSTSSSSADTGLSTDRDLNCSVFMPQAQMTNATLIQQSENTVSSTVEELEQNSSETQESPPGEVTGSPLSSEMMNLLSESCD